MRTCISLIVVGFILMTAFVAVAAVSITAATGGSNISADKSANATSAAWTSLTQIVVAEAGGSSGKDDFSSPGGTLVLKAPTGFEFNTNVLPSITFASGNDISSASIAMTNSTTLVVTVNIGGIAKNDNFTIGSTTNLQVRPTSGNLLTNGVIYRPTTSGGTLVASGLNTSASGNGSGGTSFGTLSEVAGNAAKLNFTVNPASAVVGAVFGTQPTIHTQDQFGNNTSVGLGATLNVTIALASGTGPLLGTTVANIGTSGGNGTLTSSNLRIDSVGSDKQLSAAATGLTTGLSSTFTVNKGSQTVTFTAIPNHTYGDAPFTLSATASSGLPVSFSVVSGNATISGDTVTLTGTGSVTISASQAGDANWNAATSVQRTFTVSKGSQSITFPTISNHNYGDAPFTVNATASSGLSVSYSIASGNATVSGNTITITGLGSITVTASQAGDTNWNAAPNVQRSFTVAKGTPTITWSNPADIIYGTVLSGTQLNGTASNATTSVSGTFNYSPPAGTVLNAGTNTLSVTFTPTDTVNYNNATASVSIVVLKATPTITWNNPADIVYGTALSGTQLNATTPVAGTFNYSPAAGTVLNAGTNSLSVTFTPSNPSNYNSNTAAASIVVLKATPTITWNNPADIIFGTALSGTQLNATSPVVGTFNYSPAAGTVLNAGANVLSVTFTPSNLANYNANSATVSLVVQKATPTITWATPADIIYGTALSGTQLNATASVPGMFNYSPPEGTVLNGGTNSLSVTFTPSDGANYTNSTASVSIKVLKLTPTVTWSNPADIFYGTALSTNELNATASVAGSFAYTPNFGTVLNAGTNQTLSVLFTPTDSVNYSNVTASVSINVLKLTPTITWNNPVDIFYDTYLGTNELNATASVAGSFIYTPDFGTVLNAGTNQALSVLFSPTDSVNYNTASASVSINVLKTTPMLTWNNPADIFYGMALSTNELNATTPVAGSFVYTPDFGTVLSPGTNQALSVSFTPTDSANYNNATNSVFINVLKAIPAITWNNPADIIYGTALSTNELNATASVAGSFVYSPDVGTVLSAGTNQMLSVSFTPTDLVHYDTTLASVSINVLKAIPSITWNNPADIVYGTTLNGVQLDATASVAGTFTYSPLAGTVLNAGTNILLVMFTPADSTNYNSNSASVSIVVTKANPTVSWNNPAEIVYGTELGTNELNATASVAGSFAYTPDFGTVLDAGTNETLSVTFTPSDTANYNTASASVAINVLKATPEITWNNPTDIVFSTPLSGAQLNATTPISGSFNYIPPVGTVLNAGTNTLSVSFTPIDLVNYNSNSATVSIVVLKATPAISWSNPADIVYGTALSTNELNATVLVAGSLAYAPNVGTVLNAGTNILSVTFTPSDSENYNSNSTTVSIVVLKATPTITWNDPADIIYGTALSGTQLNATASITGTFNYSPAVGTVLNVGTNVLSVNFTPDDSANYNSASATASLVVLKVTPTITWSNPADIVYGTALGTNELNATASVAGSFAYTPDFGTVLAAGTNQTLSVLFTPSDSANYSAASTSVLINVLKATPTVTWNDPADIVFETALSGTQLNATSSVAGIFDYTPATGVVLNAGTNILSVSFTPNDLANYNSNSATVAIVVLKATPTISWSDPVDIFYGRALSSSELNATASVAGSFVYTPDFGTVLNAGTNQTLSVLFTPDAATNYTTASASVSINVLKATPTINWNNPADIVYGTALDGTQLNATASVAGTFSYTPPASTVLNAGAGQTLSVLFTPSDSANFSNATASVSINVLKANQTINFPPIADHTFNDAPFTISASASSGLVPSFSIVSGDATVLGDVITITGSGSVTVEAAQAGDSNYNAAPPVSQSFTVNKDNVTLTWTNPANIVFGTALSTNELNATPSVAGTFVYLPDVGTILDSGSNRVLSVSFTPANTNYNAASTSVSINVLKAASSIVWNNPADIFYGMALSTNELNAVASIPGALVYTPDLGTVLNAGTNQTLSVTLTPANTNYIGASASTSINVLKATPTITWNHPADIIYGTALSSVQLNAAASVPGSFAYTPVAGAVLNSGPGQTLSVLFTPDAATNYNTVTASVSINVLKATPTITWVNPADIFYGTALGANELNATASAAGSFAYAPDFGTILNAGTSQTLSVTLTPANTNYNNTSASVAINVLKATPTITWNNPADISYGTALSGTQMNATAPVPGSFAYTPDVGAVLSSGTGQTLSVLFTPDAATNYNPATASVTINVLPSPSFITWTNPADVFYGTALSTNELNAVASIPGTLVYTPNFGTVLNAGTNQTLSVIFTPNDTNYNNQSASVSINVHKATPAISWSNPADIFYGTALSTNELNATTPIAGSFAYTPAAGTVLNAGTNQTLSLLFTPNDTTNYTSASGAVSINVLKATPTITWSNPADIIYGTALSGTELNATSPVSGAFNYSPPAGTVLNAGIESLSVSFVPSDLANYNSAIAGVVLHIAKAASVTAVTVSDAVYNGNQHGGSAVVTGAVGLTQSLPVTYAGTASTGDDYGPTTIAPVNPGSYVASASFGGTTNYESSSDNKSFNITLNDGDAPLLTVKAPKSLQVIPGTVPSLLITGTVTEAHLANVSYKLNSNSFTPVANLRFVKNDKPTNWWGTITSGFVPGTNHLMIKAVDLAGQESVGFDTNIFWHVASPLTIEIQGGGTVENKNKPFEGDNAHLFIGRGYTLKAIASSAFDWVLTNITYTAALAESGELKVNTLAASKNTIGFNMKTNMHITFHFIQNPAYQNAGTYYGLFSESTGYKHASAGFVKMKLTSKFKVSGKLAVEGDTSVPFTCYLNISGNGTANVDRTDFGKSPLIMTLNADWANKSITGTVSNLVSGWSSSLLAHLALWDDDTNPASDYVNRYTAVIPGFANESDGPCGYSYELISVNAKGQPKADGNSADMEKIKATSSVLSKDGDWPFYSPMYKTPAKTYQGEVIGWLHLNGPAGHKTPNGELAWIKTAGWTNYPGGFTNSATAIIGSLWLVPTLGDRAIDLNSGAGVLTLSGGGVTTTNVIVTLGTDNKLIPDSSVVAKIYKPSITTKTGLMKGTFVAEGDASNVKTKFCGVLLQDQNYGRGFFMRASGGGTAVLNSAP